MKRNNQGITLVELLVTMAIMAVLGGMLTVGFGIVPRTEAKSCAEGLKTIIGQTRIQTMGKKETVLELKHDSTDGKLYTVVKTKNEGGSFVSSSPELCGKKNVKVSIHKEGAGAGSYEPLVEGKSFVISFDRSTGKELKGGIADSAGNTSALCDYIKVEGGTATYLIHIYTATGKVTME